MAGMLLRQSARFSCSGICRLAAQRLGLPVLVLDVKDIAAIAREEQVQRLLCCSQPVKDPPWQVGRQLLLEHPEKGEAISKGRFPFCGQHEGSALCFFQQLTPAQGAHQRPELFP